MTSGATTYQLRTSLQMVLCLHVYTAHNFRQEPPAAGCCSSIW